MRLSAVLLITSWIPLIQLQLYKFDADYRIYEENYTYWIILFLLSVFVAWLTVKKHFKRVDSTRIIPSLILMLLLFVVLFGILAIFIAERKLDIKLLDFSAHKPIICLISAALSFAALVLSWREAQKTDRPYLSALKFILASIFLMWQLNLGLHLYYKFPFSLYENSYLSHEYFGNTWFNYFNNVMKGLVTFRPMLFIGYTVVNLLFFGEMTLKGKFKEKQPLFFSAAGLLMVSAVYILIALMVAAVQLVPEFERDYPMSIAFSFITVIGPLLMIALLSAIMGGVLLFLKKGRTPTSVFTGVVRKKALATALITIILYLFLFGSVWPIKDPGMDVLMGIMKKDKDRFWSHTNGLALNEMSNASFLEFFLFGNAATMPLINNLKDEDTFVKEISAVLLRYLGDERAIEPLIEKLKDKSVQNRAAWALALFKDKRAFLPLITALKKNELVHDAIPALGKLEDWRAVDPLLARLDDEDPEIRKSTAIALGYFHDTRVAEVLFNRLQNDKSDGVKWEINRVLRTMLDMYVPYFQNVEKMKEWWQEWWDKYNYRIEIIFLDEREKKGLNSR